jgi:3-hydroxyacyl-CoA dehydrogenase
MKFKEICDMTKRNDRFTVIIDGVRSPMGVKKGRMLGIRPDDLTAQVITALIKRNTRVPVDKIVASAELYCGSVEVGVGLIPGAGANLRLLLNWMKALEKKRPGPFPPVQQAFETIAFAKVSTSAHEAIKLGYLTKQDCIVVNPEHLLYEAKQTVLELARDYTSPPYREDIYLPGTGGRLAIENTMDGIVKAGKISEHDRLIGKKLAYVLTGGDKASPTRPVDEQYILDLEREAFVSLCGEKLTQDRMAHMLKTGKPLRN